MRYLFTLFTLAAALIAPVSAGYYYEAVTKDDQGNTTKVKAWVTGYHAKIMFEQTDNPMAEKGQYLVTEDGGKTLYLVDDNEKTYTQFDLGAMMNFAENTLGGMMKLEFTDPSVEQLDKKAGGQVLGHDTTYYKFRTRYDMKLKMMGIKRTNKFDTVSEVWVTDKSYDPGFGAWLRTEQPTGNEQLDKLIAGQMKAVKGFPLKTVTVTNTKQVNKRGKVKNENTVKSTTEVTVLRQEDVSTSISDIPDGYEKVELIPQDEEGGSPFKGLFNRDNN